MLHVGVLPHHDRWGDVLANLAYVVVDEAHVYRGVFGSHVGNVLRRLRRLARIYGADPQFLLASATIANPGELAPLAARPRRDRDRRRRRAARRADDRALEPAARSTRSSAIRASALGEASRLMAELVSRGPAHALLREEPEVGGADPPVHRRPARPRVPRPPLAVPRRLHARPAPRHRAAARRRRAARRVRDRRARARDRHRAARLRDLDRLPRHGREPPPAVGPRRPPRPRARACSSPSEDALDQYFMREPETLLGRRVEAAILDHANPRVLDGHVRAAAFEAPLDDADRDVLGDEALERAALLPELRQTPGRVRLGRPRLPGRARPAPLDEPRLVLGVDTPTGSVLGLVERERAYSTVHEGAVYLHLGEAYRVAELDLDARQALVAPFAGDLYTQAKKDTTTAIEAPRAHGATPRPRADLGPRLRHRAGRRLPGEAGIDAGDARPRRARPAGDDVRDGGDLVLPGGVDARGDRAHAEASSAACTRPSMR